MSHRENASVAAMAAVSVSLLGLAACSNPGAPSAGADSEARAASRTSVSGPSASMGSGGMSGNYRAELEPLGGSGVRGIANFRLKGERLAVRLTARGLTPGREHGQHIHMNASCADFGGVQIPLDFDLADTDDGFGGPFPRTSGMSQTLTYSQMASDGSFAGLMLGEKTVVVHAGTPSTDPTPVACGEIDPVGDGG